MKCPICSQSAGYTQTDADKKEVTVEYLCDHGHLIQFILPQFLYTALILGPDGDELYQFYFTADQEITHIYSWNEYKLLDLEGTGVQQYPDIDFELIKKVFEAVNVEDYHSFTDTDYYTRQILNLWGLDWYDAER